MTPVVPQNTDESALIEALLPRAKQIALTFARRTCRTEDVDDFVSDAMFGVLEAVRAYRRDYGVPLAAYSAFIVTNRLRNGLRSRSALGERNAATLRQADLAAERITSQWQRSATTAEIESQVPRYKTARIRANWRTTMRLTNVDPENGQESIRPDAPHTPAAETVALAMFDRETLHSALVTLKPRLRRVIEQHYFHDMKLVEIAKHERITRQRVSQLHHKALAVLSTYLTAAA